MTPRTTFVAALVRTLRGHGGRPAAAGPTPTWGEVAAEARDLALGLRTQGVGEGVRVVVPPATGGPAVRLLRELAVLSAGGVLALPPTGGERDGSSDAVLDDEGLAGVPVARLLAAGRDRSDPPDAYEALVAGILGDATAVVAGEVVVTHEQLQWALRSVERWLVPVVGPWGPGRVLALAGADGAGPGSSPLAAALVGRWWPATAGAQLVDADPTTSAAEAIRATGAVLVVADPTAWAEVAGSVRARAERSRRGRALLRRGRLVAAGEPLGPAEAVERRVLARRTGPAVRARAGVGDLVLGISLGVPDRASGRDLAALGVPVVPTWVDRHVPAPVAAGPVVHPWPAGRRGRPLPGRSLACGGATTTVHGGDLPGGAVALPVRTVPDARDRVALR